MNLSALLGPVGGIAGSRFLTVSYLPTVGCSAFLLVLTWAGAPGGRPDFHRAWTTAAGLGVGELLLLWLAVTLLALALHPLQLRLVRLLEGEWPGLPDRLRRRAVARQEARRTTLARQRTIVSADPPDQATANRAGIAGTLLSTRFPPDGLPAAPTRLGNVLAAVEHRAGATYELDAVVVWPRLYPLLDTATKDVVDTNRDALDGAARLAVTAALTALASAALLGRAGWWLLLALAPAGLARVAYLAAVESAAAYGTALEAAIELHRFALYERLGLPRPPDLDAERAANAALCTLWRQGRIPGAGLTYRQE
ncbi:hypothetical protein AB0C76_26405 [Kitasatospora sp. NPDC048722]|uniref:hypothetical protein n=1 Tax=Kitasatospora sp. NPDC048722 TaxID=3155639 RepID=UPI0033F67D4D